MNETVKKKKLRPDAIRTLFKRFVPHLRGHGSTLLVAGLCMLGVTVMELLRPWPMKIIFDGILMPREGSSTILDNFTSLIDGLIALLVNLSGFLDNVSWLQENFPGFFDDFPGYLDNLRARIDLSSLLLVLTSLSFLGIAVFNGLFGYGQTYLIASVSQKVMASIRRQLYSHIHHLSHSFHDESRTGDLLTRLTSDVKKIKDLLIISVMFLGDRLLVVAAMLAIMLWMDWQLTVVALAIMPLLIWTLLQFTREIKGAARRQRRNESEIANIMTEKLSAISLVQGFARAAYEDARFSGQTERTVETGLLSSRLEAHLSRLVQVILAVGIASVIWLGASQVQAGLLTPGDLLVFVSYMKGLYKPIRRLAALNSKIAKATVSGERILAILDTEPEIKNAPHAVDASPVRGEIVFDGIEFAYQPETPVLRGVNFHIKSGERVALFGESGSGKSTIASLLLRFYDPVKGRVMVDGTDIRYYTLDSLRGQIAIVLQDPLLFSATIAENIAYGKLDASEEEIINAAKAANAHDFIEGLPYGYDTVLGERGDTLSGGQRQRIAIARAIVRKAPIVVMDEPTAALDVVNKDKVEQALVHLTRHSTCLVITHDLQTAVSADRVLLVREGRVVETTAEVMMEESRDAVSRWGVSASGRSE